MVAMVTKRIPAVPPLLSGLWTTVLGFDRAPAVPVRVLSSSLLAGVFVAVGVGSAVFVFSDLGDIELVGLPTAVRLVLAAAVTAPVALLPRRPLLAWRIATVATLVNLPVEVAPDGLSWPWHPLQVLLLPAMVLFVAVRQPAATIFWTALLTAAAMAAHLSAAQAPVVVAFVALFAVVGDQIRRRVEAQHDLTTERRLTQVEQARRVVLEERARIAREMHDVVAHHMSLIAVRAETAPYRLSDEPGTRESEFLAIASASRAALTDMRRLLGVLRSDPDAAATAPSGLAAIPAMVEAAGAAGLEVTMTSTSRPEAVTATPAVEQCAYRIVQEAISNATRHAPGAAIRITVTTDDRALHVSVHNTDPGPSPSTRAWPAAGGGHGLTGMRERVGALGGELTAGPARAGGFEVSAALPLRPRTSLEVATVRP
jgi:signal transduction histidine kinase